MFVEDRRFGCVTASEGGYVLAIDPDTEVAPDVGSIRAARFPAGFSKRGLIEGAPDLAVEVISPSDSPADALRKQALCEREKVPLVWWADQEAQTLTVLKRGASARVLTREGTLDGGEVLPGFTLDLEAIFRE
jgi:Uma2 family endonuclease